MKAAGHWPRALGTKNKTKAIDRNLSSTLIRPHQGQRERQSKKERMGGERKRNGRREDTEEQGHRRTKLKTAKVEK